MEKNQPHSHKIESSTWKSACKISDQFGGLVAEVNPAYIHLLVRKA